jgi:DNA-binding PadR family transcriptional regulator
MKTVLQNHILDDKKNGYISDMDKEFKTEDEPKKVLELTPQGKKKRESRRISWIKEIYDENKVTQKPFEETDCVNREEQVLGIGSRQ